MNSNPVKLDVREDIRNGGDPFSKIMNVVARLAPGADLLLLAPFEPVPLYFVLEQEGFTHRSQLLDSGDWEVVFARKAISAAPLPRSCGSEAQAQNPSNVNAGSDAGHVNLDTRGLEPPEPLVRILEAVASLPRNSTLYARTDRRPIHLYPQLEDRGFSGTTEEQIDGSFITTIRHH